MSIPSHRDPRYAKKLEMVNLNERASSQQYRYGLLKNSWEAVAQEQAV